MYVYDAIISGDKTTLRLKGFGVSSTQGEIHAFLSRYYTGRDEHDTKRVGILVSIFADSIPFRA